MMTRAAGEAPVAREYVFFLSENYAVSFIVAARVVSDTPSPRHKTSSVASEKRRQVAVGDSGETLFVRREREGDAQLRLRAGRSEHASASIVFYFSSFHRTTLSFRRRRRREAPPRTRARRRAARARRPPRCTSGRPEPRSRRFARRPPGACWRRGSRRRRGRGTGPDGARARRLFPEDVAVSEPFARAAASSKLRRGPYTPPRRKTRRGNPGGRERRPRLFRVQARARLRGRRRTRRGFVHEFSRVVAVHARAAQVREPRDFIRFGAGAFERGDAGGVRQHGVHREWFFSIVFARDLSLRRRYGNEHVRRVPQRRGAVVAEELFLIRTPHERRDARRFERARALRGAARARDAPPRAPQRLRESEGGARDRSRTESGSCPSSGPTEAAHPARGGTPTPKPPLAKKQTRSCGETRARTRV